ncbi:hypothetical protein [Vibrio coralliilyticus]|uniref:hypothetical protein n=1 Tax=Vibrio coralliilyticus TaxID=190893 RepID=UPI001E490481|nr:hypothetical protein [Vibrio coralliilyticus]MCC2525805.1 hypothetical protein [Vibrio coralliilyticus]
MKPSSETKQAQQTGFPSITASAAAEKGRQKPSEHDPIALFVHFTRRENTAPFNHAHGN